MVVNQGDVFWVDLQEPLGSGPGYRRPCVVIQNNLFNHSSLRTVVVCLLTSNLRHARVPGNILLERGEGDLPRRSVVLVTETITVDKSQLVEKIGALSPRRVQEIGDGIVFLVTPREGLQAW
ncbi:MAG: type II toxin-antitoxin system PemK/MazF family toxin [Planctomycetes bacterium]|nr:type II toxin-antitoxin system PemK/MazF family toxin [Planctomycetota bacterium]